jgi:hypothetical protein
LDHRADRRLPASVEAHGGDGRRRGAGDRTKALPQRRRRRTIIVPAAHRESTMDDDTLNMSTRKFLKTVGVGSQRAIEQAVARALAEGRLGGNEVLAATMTLKIGALALELDFDGEIRLQ